MSWSGFCRLKLFPMQLCVVSIKLNVWFIILSKIDLVNNHDLTLLTDTSTLFHYVCRTPCLPCGHWTRHLACHFANACTISFSMVDSWFLDHSSCRIRYKTSRRCLTGDTLSGHVALWASFLPPHTGVRPRGHGPVQFPSRLHESIPQHALHNTVKMKISIK